MRMSNMRVNLLICRDLFISFNMYQKLPFGANSLRFNTALKFTNG